jgi:hypothetical protein
MSEIHEIKQCLQAAGIRQHIFDYARPSDQLTWMPVELKAIDIAPLTKEAQEARLPPYHLMSICQNSIYVFDGLGAVIYRFSSGGQLAETQHMPSFPNKYISPLDMNFTVFQDDKEQQHVAIFDQDKKLLSLVDSKWKTLSTDKTHAFVGETPTARLYAVHNGELGFFFEDEWNVLVPIEDGCMSMQDMTLNATQILTTAQNHVMIYNKHNGSQMAKIEMPEIGPLGIVSLNENMFVVAQNQLAVWGLQHNNDWKNVHNFGPHRSVVFFGDGGSLDHFNPRCVGQLDHQIVCLYDNNSDRLCGSLLTGVQHLGEPCEPQPRFYSAPDDAKHFDPHLWEVKTRQQKKGIFGCVMMILTVLSTAWFVGMDVIVILVLTSMGVGNIFVPANRRRCGCQHRMDRASFRKIYGWAILTMSLAIVTLTLKAPLWGILGHFDIHPWSFATMNILPH